MSGDIILDAVCTRVLDASENGSVDTVLTSTKMKVYLTLALSLIVICCAHR